MPFATAWMGGNKFAARPVALYGFALYWVVALVWLVPDRRIEWALSHQDPGEGGFLP